jgi:hypothetical protein
VPILVACVAFMLGRLAAHATSAHVPTLAEKIDTWEKERD